MTRRGTTVAVAAFAVLASGCGVVEGLQAPVSLTFRVDSVQCAPSTSATTIGTLCSFFAYYGNVSKHPVQVEPSTTLVMDKAGRAFSPVAEEGTGSSFLLKPGAQRALSWSVTMPVNSKPVSVQWHGSTVQVQFDVTVASAAPSVAAASVAAPSVPASVPPSVPPSSPAPTTAAPTTPAPTTTPVPTTTKPKPKPTKPKPTKTTVKPTKTTAKPTTHPPTTPPPPQPTTHRPTHRPTTPPPVTPTTNSTNPGGGSGGIG